jgi:hypothetical protein
MFYIITSEIKWCYFQDQIRTCNSSKKTRVNTENIHIDHMINGHSLLEAEVSEQWNSNFPKTHIPFTLSYDIFSSIYLLKR